MKYKINFPTRKGGKRLRIRMEVMKLKFIEKIIVASILFALFSCKSASLNGKWVSLEDGYFSKVTLDICDNQFRITNLPSTLYMPDDDFKENIIFLDFDGAINKNESSFDIDNHQENITFSDFDGVINKNELSFDVDTYKVKMYIVFIYSNLSQSELTLIFENGIEMNFTKDKKK